MINCYEFGPFRLNVKERQLTRKGQPVHLEPKAFDLLCELVGEAGQLARKEALLKQVWPNVLVTENSLARCIHQLRSALGDPSDSPEYIETVAGAGYRFIAPVREHATLTQASERDGGRQSTAKTRTAVAGLVVVLLLTAAGWLFVHESSAPVPGIRRLAVLPLANLTGDPGQAYLVKGVHEALISELSRIDGLEVISRTSVMRYENTNLDVPQIADELDIDALVEGSVLRDGERLSVIAQLIAADPERHLWSDKYDRSVGNMFEMTTAIATAIADIIAPEALPLNAMLPARRPVNPKAYDAYLQGRFKFLGKTREDYEQALRSFERAIEIEPRFAPAYNGLAHTLGSSAIFGMRPPGESMPKVRELAKKALEIDGTSEDAHLMLAGVSFYWEWNWAEAERRLRRVLELNPNSAAAYRMLAEVLSVEDRHEAALAAIERARALDPMAPNSQLKPSLIHYLKRDYPAAAASARAAISHFEGYWLGHWMLCRSLTAWGEFEAAIEACEQAATLSKRAPLALASLGYAYARADQRGKAMEILDGLESLRQRQYVGPAYLAVIHGALGEKRQAFIELNRAFQERDITLCHAAHAAEFDSLRTDPRFLALSAGAGKSPSS